MRLHKLQISLFFDNSYGIRTFFFLHVKKHFFFLPLLLCSVSQCASYRTGKNGQMIESHLEVEMRYITEVSFAGRNSSPVRGMAWPSEGDDVMN